jgi:hypothetical protein
MIDTDDLQIPGRKDSLVDTTPLTDHDKLDFFLFKYLSSVLFMQQVDTDILDRLNASLKLEHFIDHLDQLEDAP